MVSRCWQVLDERAWRIRGAHIGWRPDYLEAVDSFGSAEKLYRMAAAVTRALGPK